jgi:hypothetical protein
MTATRTGIERLAAGFLVNDSIPPKAGVLASRRIAVIGCEFTEMSEADIEGTLEQSC